MTPAPPPHDTPPVLVEALLLRHDPDGGFSFRRELAALHRADRPDDAVRRLAGAEAPAVAALGGAARSEAPYLVHSTSWRATEEGQIVLTYVVHPDPEPARPGAVPLEEPRLLARGADAGHPAPVGLRLQQVAAHALRHVAFLARTDPVVAAHLGAHPGAGAALAGLPTDTAGQLQGV